MRSILISLVVLLSTFAFQVQADGRPVYSFVQNVTDVDVTESDYVELEDSMPAACTYLVVGNTTAVPVYLAIGAEDAEVNIPYYFIPSVNPEKIFMPLAKGVRLAARAVGVTADSGFLSVNCLQK